MDDKELARLLDAVSLRASKLDDQKFQQITGETKSDEKSKESSLESLPLNCKLQILDFINQEKHIPLIDDPKKLLPKVEILRHLKTEKLKFFTKNQLEQLDQIGFFVVDNFMGDAEVAKKAHTEADSLFSQGKLRVSHMSQGEEMWSDKKIRGDTIMWLNERWQIQEDAPTLYNVLNRIDDLRMELNEACNLDSQKTQVRHFDAYVGGSTRRLTFLYYFNPGWQKKDGGQLKIYTEDGAVEIEPIADRLLVFQSRQLEHEVLPAYSKRFAITMWFY